MKQMYRILGLVLAVGLLETTAVGATTAGVEEEINLSRRNTIPIAVTGFTPEVRKVLQFDLTFMGFENVPLARAQFQVSGTASGRVQGKVVDRGNQTVALSKAYTGATIRKQAHAFANDICRALTGKPGIALTEITFKTEVGRSRSEIYIADFDGYNARPVTRDGSLVVAPTWGKGRTLLYTSYKLGKPSIFSHDLGTGQRRSVAHYPGSNISPAVSPDGTKVAMILSKSGSPDLYVANVDGTGLIQLTRTRAEESSPCWSPDGSKICFVSKSSGVNQLYSISPRGGTRRRIATSGVVNPTEPDWSPDGKWIVFTSLMRDFNICVVPATGGKAVAITFGEDPTWAPNSRAVIFCRGRDREKHLSLLDVFSGQVKDVRRILESNSQPSWRK